MTIPSIVCNYSLLYTQAHNVDRNTKRKEPKPVGMVGGGAPEGTVTKVPAKSFSINIINGNTSIKADFS